MKQNVIYFLIVLIILLFVGAAGTAIYLAFKAGTGHGIVSIIGALGIGWILFSMISRRYKIYKAAESMSDDKDEDNADDVK